VKQEKKLLHTPVRGDKKVIFGWAVYDWANSAYITTIAVAILPMYFAGVIVPVEGFRIGGTVFRRRVHCFCHGSCSWGNRRFLQR
jgi:MFS-type transporter involved in bile tolerance (Atg22 family)